MKKIILYAGILFHIISCQQDFNVTPLPSPADDERVPVTFTMALPGEITSDTEIVPMSRTAGDTVMADVLNKYRAIITKKVGDNWYIDTVLNPRLNSMLDNGIFMNTHLPVYRNSTWDPLHLELRPGTYRIAVFLNPGTLNWNTAVKSGTFVATDADIRAGKSVLPAASVRTLNGFYVIYSEIFTGAAEFKVEKNTRLGSRAASPVVNVRLERKVSRFRYLLRVPTDDSIGGFGGTQYWLTAVFKAPAGQYFCEGLDVLGKPYYATRDAIQIYCSAAGNNFYSEVDDCYYQMPVEIPDNFPTAGSMHPTNYCPFILAEKDMECTFTLSIISGSSPGNQYTYPTDIPYTLRANGINGFAFERDPNVEPSFDGTYLHLDARLVDGVDVRESFHPFYELNAVRTDIPSK